MRSKIQNVTVFSIGSAAKLAMVCGLAIITNAGPKPKDVVQPTAKAFATPDDAAQALVKAATSNDVPALLEILGPDSKDLLTTEDPVEDKNRGLAFAALAREKSSVSVDSANHTATLLVGNDDWPLPIPIVKRNGSWFFDAKSGRTSRSC